MNKLGNIIEEIVYFIMGMFFGIVILLFIKSSNYTEKLQKDIKLDLNIDINKNKE